VRTHYVHLPLIYDQWQKSYGRDFTTAILPRLLSTLRKFKVRKSSLVDLACGTGTLAVTMAERGWKVWGVDASPGMMEEARKKTRETSLPVEFVLQDMRSFVLPERVSLVTCLFDSLNHLIRKRDIAATFRRVSDSLTPGGYFVFDVNNEHCFRNVWVMSDQIPLKDATLVLENSYNVITQIGRSQISIFTDTHAHYHEVVNERYYTKEAIEELLGRTGFRVLQAEDFNFTGRREIGKIKTWWVARKEIR